MSQCHQKARITTMKKAIARADKYEQETGKVFGAYACYKCGFYHVGKESDSWRIIKSNNSGEEQ